MKDYFFLIVRQLLVDNGFVTQNKNYNSINIVVFLSSFTVTSINLCRIKNMSSRATNTVILVHLWMALVLKTHIWKGKLSKIGAIVISANKNFPSIRDLSF